MTKEIPLTQGKVALVDDEDYSELSKFKWCAQKERNGKVYYAHRGTWDTNTHKGGLIQMHAAIMNTPKGLDTDHINGNGIDNRRENLRVVTHRQNCQNLHIKKTSKFSGVYWNECRDKWMARIKTKGKTHFLGRYIDEETAGIVYAMACNALKMGVVL